mgnify:CR=1 FL=1
MGRRKIIRETVSEEKKIIETVNENKVDNNDIDKKIDLCKLIQSNINKQREIRTLKWNIIGLKRSRRINRINLTRNLRKLNYDLNVIQDDISKQKEKIKTIPLKVSAPFHCELMKTATELMRNELAKIVFKEFQTSLISNVTAQEIDDNLLIRDLLIRQIESRVRWRESINYMIKNGVKNFIEIGPGKVLSGLVKRIDKKVKVSAINNEEDIKTIKI